MKNKIILSIILSALGITAFNYVNNIQNVKNLYKTNYASVDNVYKKNNSDLFTSNSGNLTKTKLHSNKRNAGNNVSQRSNSATNLFANNIVTINSTKDYNANAGTAVVTNANAANKEQKYQRSSGTNIVPLIASAKTGNIESNASYSGVTTTPSISGRQSASTTTLDGAGDVIIVDPGGDPDPNSRIPVGEGMYILILLAGTYIVYGIQKRKKATR